MEINQEYSGRMSDLSLVGSTVLHTHQLEYIVFGSTNRYLAAFPHSASITVSLSDFNIVIR